MKLRAALFLFLFVPTFFLHAQNRVFSGAAEIKQQLESLNTSGSVLYIAAHPDDENTRLLAYLAQEKKIRTGYLSLTRGDGGQNLIGNEQADLLGLIRTQELIAARLTDGAQQFFTRANDFGFSKNPAESFKIWDKQKILSDVVWVIRTFRPDLIITRFPEDSRAGHGHHSASAILAREAFAAAADPKQFPEQLKYVKVWQAKRILWNTFNFGGSNTTSEDQLKLDVGAFNPLLGKSYGEIAALSRSNHKSQGFGSAKQRGSAIEYFSPVGGEAAKNDIFENINFGLDRNAGMQAIQKLLNEINAGYKVSDPAASLPKLLELRKLVRPAQVEFKKELLDEIILACAGIWIETNVPAQAYALTDTLAVQLQAIVRAKNTLPVKISMPKAGISANLKPNQMSAFSLKVPAVALGTTQPYWLQERHPVGAYVVSPQTAIGMPENQAPSAGPVMVEIGGEKLEVFRPIVYKFTDPVKGEVYQPLAIAPPVTATLAEKAYVFNGNSPRTFSVQLKSFQDGTKGTLKVLVPKGWKATPENIDFSLAKKGDEEKVEFTLSPAGEVNGGTLALNISTGGKTYDKGLHVIAYDHIPLQTLFPFAEAKVERLNLKITNKKLGYIAGAGDLIPESLRQLGYEVNLLSENEVLNKDLSAFDAIITGVRLYNINEQVKAMQPKLMKYVENGGTLMVQYNVNAPLKIAALGPYPFKLTRDRVTEEDAEVTFLAPGHPVLNVPNKITAKDFEGWIQERGLYFASDLDAKYTPVLSMHDTGEQPLNGSLFIASYGKGKYVYSGLSFFRELPAGVPGAYRLFVNLISNPALK